MKWENTKGKNKLSTQEEGEEQAELEVGEGGGQGGGGSAVQQRAWEGAPAGNLKEKLGEPENV